MQTLFVIFSAWLFTQLQGTVIYPLRVAGVGPDFILIGVIFYSLKGGIAGGAWAGFWMGIVLDCYSAAPFGFHALLYSFIGVSMGYLAKYFYWEHWRAQSLGVLFACCIQYFFFEIIKILFFHRVSLMLLPFSLLAFFWILTTSALLTPLFFVLFYKVEIIIRRIQSFIKYFLEEHKTNLKKRTP